MAKFWNGYAWHEHSEPLKIERITAGHATIEVSARELNEARERPLNLVAKMLEDHAAAVAQQDEAFARAIDEEAKRNLTPAEKERDCPCGAERGTSCEHVRR